MTGFLFGGILLLTVVCWMKLRDEALRPFAIGVLAAAPFLLFSTIVIYTFATAPAGEYRVALEGVEVDLADGQAVTVGGGAEGEEADDVIVSGLPPRYLTFRVEGQHVVAALPAELGRAVESPAYAAVRVDQEKPFANSVALKGASVVIDGFGPVSPVIPPRRQEITENWSFPIWRNLTADTVLYPLRFWARAKPSDDAVHGPDGAPLGSFLSHEGGFFRRTLFVTLTGDGTHAGAVHYNPRVAVIEPGTPHTFALYRIDYADPIVDENSRSRAQERRSFRVSYEKGRLAIVFDTPDFVRLAPKQIETLVTKGELLLATRDPRRDAPVIANQMVLSFPQLGSRVQNELFSVIRVAESGDCRVRVTAHTGTRCYASGEAFRIGERVATILRVTKIGTPWGIIATLFLLALFSFLWMQRRPADTVAIVIVSAAEVLLAVRLLIAFEGALLDPAAAAGVWESLVAFALLPLTLRVARNMRITRDTLVECGAIAVIVAIALVRANVAMVWIAAVCVAVFVVPLAAGRFGNTLMRRIAALRWSFRAILAGAAIVAGLRVAMLWGLGWKERISIPGVDLALTIVYLPIVFLFFAALWRRYRLSALQYKALSWKQIGAGFAAAGAGVLLAVLVPAFVKDSGSALVHVPAIVLLFALPALARPKGVTLALAAPLVLMLLGHLAVAFLPHLRGQDKADPSYQKALADEQEADDFMARRLGQSTNQLRILSQVAPHQLEQAGTSKAEGLVMQRRVLDRYGGTGLFGAGYLNVPLTTFRDTHMNDNLSAIHILAPFGIVGAVGLLALLLALGLLPLRERFADAKDDRPERAIDSRAALGILALWTFSLCGIYMIAANLGLVLFTGKNVYLLAATSNSDAIEGGVLLLIALVALSPKSPLPSGERARVRGGSREKPEGTS
jgi:hypothetical protein